jgi:hypothetical protein
MATHAHIDCPSCGARIAAEDMNLSAMAARCRSCHAFVDLRAASAGASTSPAQTPAEPLPVPRPAQIQVVERGLDVTLTRRWFSWVYVFLALFCTVWNGFLLVWYTTAAAGDAPLFFLLFPLLHVAVGVGLAYFTLAGFVNRTVLTVERGEVSVRHGPLPWPGNVDVSAGSLEQLFCTEKVIRSRNGTTVRYNVEAVLRDGRQLTLLKALDAQEEALFIEQTLERHLGIPDRRVRSEMRV